MEVNQDVHPAYKGMERPINLNIGMIKGGDWPSSVPAMAEIHGRFGYFPGKTFVEAQQGLVEAVKRAAKEDDWLSKNQPQVEFYGLRHNGFSIERNLPAFRTLNDCHKAIAGDEARQNFATAASDLCVFHDFGKYRSHHFRSIS